MTVHPGIDILLAKQVELIAGKRIGLIASPSSVDQALTSSIERLLHHPGVSLACLFGPEHGVRGSAQAGDHVSTYVDAKTELPVYSLYGETKKPTRAMVEGLDALIYDLQDGGVRFYTYLSTLIYTLEAGAEYNLPVIILDRPNPISGHTAEGPMLNRAYSSFVGMAPVPIRHAMTAGELALMCNEVLGIGGDVTVVKAEGWRRTLWSDQTGLSFVPPSPNLPTLSSMTLYPGTCLVEGTSLSEGRGTTRPFEYIGAPWLDGDWLAYAMNGLNLSGARFRPVYFVPTFSKYQGQVCSGLQIHVIDRVNFRAVETVLHLFALVKAKYPEEFAWRAPWSDGGQYRPIDLLSGSSQIRTHLDAGSPVSELVECWQEDLKAYDSLCAPFLLYGD